jgi:hypothetical protein
MTMDSHYTSSVTQGQTSNPGNGKAREHRHKMGNRNGKDREYDRLLKEINTIDKWCNYGANNGLFNGCQKKHQLPAVDEEMTYSHINIDLKNAQDNLDDEKYSDSRVAIASARMSYLKVLFSKPWRWRFVNIYAGPIWIYLISFLGLVLAFYIYPGYDFISEGLEGVEQAAFYSVTWGCIGGILRGMWYLKDKVSEREYKNSWLIFFVSVPFLGGIFGALAYLILLAGILSLGVGGNSSQGLTGIEISRPEVIIPIAALAGFNWEWAVKIFRRIGDLITPSDSGSVVSAS